MKKIVFNINDYITIYPTESGWDKLIQITKDEYGITTKKATIRINDKKDGEGFRDQLWNFMDTYHEMFFNGQTYFKSSFIDLSEVKFV